MQKLLFKKGSSKVKVDGNPIVYHTAPNGHNVSNSNAPAGVQIAPSQTKVMVLP